MSQPSDLQPPTLVDVYEARRRIAPYLPRTPLYRYPALDALVGTEVWVKHENHQPVGAFKVRGGINLVAQLSEEERRAGLIAASTGNHGQSLAYAGRLFGVKVTICVPENANPVKVESMQALGAEVIFHGRDYDDAREHAEALAAAQGRYIHSGDEPPLIAGVGTVTLEILEDQPDVDVIVIPIGGGSAASGACVVVKGMRHPARLIGVQSSAAPAAYQSWKEGKLVEDRMETFAEGLATRTAFDLPQRIMREGLDDFVLVTDDEIREATRHMIEKTKNLVEPAGAAPLAAALKLGLADQKVALICSGGNISPAQLRDLLSDA